MLALRPHRAPGVSSVAALLLPLVLALLPERGSAVDLRPPFDLEVPFELTADSIEYERAGERYVAEGHVRIFQQGRQLEADWMAFSLSTKRGVARGKVRLQDGERWVTADAMEFDIETLQGRIFEADIDTGDDGLLLSARELRKTGDDRYEVCDGLLTSCRCPESDAEPKPEKQRLPWQIGTEKADIELGGYARARNATLEVLGVPMLWLPWAIVPIDSDRETGLLFPDLSFGGNNGIQVGLPFFWALLPDLNVILTPRYVERRGFKPDLELEYVLGQKSGGSLYASYVRDRSYDGSGQAPYVEDRWAVAFDHDQHLPWGWRARADVKVVSDNLYLNDFDDYGRYRRDAFLRSQLFVFNHFGDNGRVGVVGGLVHADDIQTQTPLDRDGTLLQRLPDVEFSLLSDRLGASDPESWRAGLGLVYGLGARYTYFHASDDARTANSGAAAGSFFLDGGVERLLVGAAPGAGDGAYQEGEPMLDSGHRLSLRPHLARPFRLGSVADVYPEVGYGQTLYDGHENGFAERGVLTARTTIRSRLRGQLGWLGLSNTEHRLEPYFGWAYVRPRSQADTPVFVPPSVLPQDRLRQLQLENRVLDPSDRVSRANLLVLGVDNRIFGGAHSVTGTDVSLSFEHDFESGDTGRLVLDGRSALARGRLRTHFNLSWNAETKDIDEGLMGAWLVLPSWKFVSLTTAGIRYRYLRLVPELTGSVQDTINQLDLYASVRLGDRLQLGYSLVRDVNGRETLANGGSIIYVSRCKCWALGLEVRNERGRDVYYGVRYTVTGLGDDRRDPFNLGSRLFHGSRR